MIDEPATYIGGGALCLLVIDRLVTFARTVRGKANGHSEVRPRDAMEFWELQKGIDRKLDEVLAILRRRR